MQALQMNRIKQITLSYKDRDESIKQLLSTASFTTANNILYGITQRGGISDIIYALTYEDGYVLRGSIDCEPKSAWEGRYNALTNHLRTFWNNLANVDIKEKTYVKESDVAFARNFIENYQTNTIDTGINETTYQPAFVDHLATQTTGGNIQVDYVYLKDGRMIGINDEGVVVYSDVQETTELGHVYFDGIIDDSSERTPEQWLEKRAEDIIRAILYTEPSERVYSTDNHLGNFNQRCAHLEVTLPSSVYMNANFERIEEDFEAYCKNSGYEANVTSCDEDNTVCFNIEDPSFER